MSLNHCCEFKVPIKSDARGKLGFVENGPSMPFEINRVYFLYDLNSEYQRGFHAHKELRQIIFALSGSLALHLDDGQNRRTVILDRPSTGYYLCPMIWRELSNFSEDAVCLVLASETYKASDYITNYEEFSAFVREKSNDS